MTGLVGCYLWVVDMTVTSVVMREESVAFRALHPPGQNGRGGCEREDREEGEHCCLLTLTITPHH